MVDRKPRSYRDRAAAGAAKLGSFREAAGDSPAAAENIQYHCPPQLRLPGRDAEPCDDDFQPAEAAETCGNCEDLPSLPLLTRLLSVVAVLASAGLAGALFTWGIAPLLPPLMTAEYGSGKNTPNIDNSRPTDSTQSIKGAVSSEKFASRWLGDAQKQLKMAANGVPPRDGPGSAATVSTPGPWARPSSEPRKIRTVRIRFDGSVQADSSTTAGSYNLTSTVARQASPSDASAAPSIGSEPSPSPEGEGATSPPSHFPVAAGHAEAYSGRAYVVQVASERSAAGAHASFRTLQAKFPDQLGGRDPIVTRTDLGADGIYYRAMVGPFTSMEEAAGVCSTLKGAGDNCHVERD
jgi:cell division septation protein DedD